MRARRALVLCLLTCAACPATASAGSTRAVTNAPQRTPLSVSGASRIAATSSSVSDTGAEAPVPVAPSNQPPVGRRLSANRVIAIASALPKMRTVRAKYRGSYGGAYLKGPGRWQVSFFSANGSKEIGQVIIADGSGRVLEQWTGFQVAWTMARGYPGAFGRHVNALYVWLPMCLLFVLPFLDVRRPFSLLHLDLLVLLSFSISLAFFNHGRIYASVPLAYPPLLYLLARMLSLLWPGRIGRRAGAARPGGLRLLVPAPWLVLGLVFLIAFRITLNVSDSNVIDVGYAGVIGAQRMVDGKSLYGGYPADNEHGDTYGPVNYAAYVPFQQIFGWSGKWDDLPAAHAAAIVFDLLAIGLLFLLGRRVRGPTLGIALAYAWASYPFTLYALESNSNDALVAVLVLAALLAAGSAGRARRLHGARGHDEVRAAGPRAAARDARIRAWGTRPRARPAALHRRVCGHDRDRGGACARPRFAAHRVASARSSIRPIGARRSRCGACTAACRACSPRCRSPRSCSRSRSQSFPAAKTSSGSRAPARPC